MKNKKKSIFVNIDEWETNENNDMEVITEDVDPEETDFYTTDTEDFLRREKFSDSLVPHNQLPDLALEQIEVYLSKDDNKDEIKDLSLVKLCPRCRAVMVSSIAINGAESLSFKECPDCGTLVNTYKPISYQAEAAARPERYLLLAGGFGSGKSRGNIEKIISHLILIPNARVIVSARTYPAIEATFVKDFFSIMPLRLLRRKNEMKREWVFTNGSELLLRSFDDPTKLRGINATMFVLLEASNLQYEAFELAQNRIRNTAALIPEYDKFGKQVYRYDPKARSMRPVYAHDARRILLESNPDAGWLKKNFLLDSGTVSYYGSAHREGYLMNKKTDPNKYTLVMATDANPYLPEGFIEEQARGKSPAYVQQYFYGSFNFAENLVYPNVGARIVQPHKLPPEFDERGQRALWYLIGLDYGINDALAIIYGAYSSITNKIYFFDEIYEHNLDVVSAAKKHKEKLKYHSITNQKLMLLPLFDGRSYNKRQADLQTIGDMFNNEGLFFTPSFTMIDARIVKVNAMINEEQIEIFSNMIYLIEEITNYKYAISRSGEIGEKPVDKFNHAINAMEFIIMALPLDLKNFKLSAFVPQGTLYTHNADEDKENNVVQGYFNPYQGGNKNDRSSTNYLNKLYGGDNDNRRSTSRVFHQGSQSPEDEGDNIFQAFVPGKRR